MMGQGLRRASMAVFVSLLLGSMSDTPVSVLFLFI
jgi:hypothetical protein